MPTYNPSGVPDPYTPPDGTWNVTGGITITGNFQSNNHNPNTDNLYSIGTTNANRWLANLSYCTITAAAVAAGSPSPRLRFVMAADTGLDAGYDANAVYFNLTNTVEWATGALASQRFFRITRPTLGFVGASVVTETSTVFIEGAPIQGTNATLTSTYGLHIASSQVSTSGTITTAASLYVAGPPTTSGGVITNAYPVKVAYNGITTTQVAGIFLTNDTPATAGVPVQRSPMLTSRGQVWDTDDLVSRTVDYAFQVRLVSGTTFTTTQFFYLSVAIDGGAYTDIFRWRQDGVTEAVGTNGALRGQDSAASSPTFGWVNDTNNGLFRNTTDQWSGSAAGVSRFLVAANGFNVLAVQTIASAASATLEVFEITPGTVTISGAANITTATGFNVTNFGIVTYSNASITVTAAATIYVAGAPLASGGMVITDTYAVWVDTGLSRFDGDGTHVFELPADATGNVTAATGRVPVSVAGATKYFRYFDD